MNAMFADIGGPPKAARESGVRRLSEQVWIQELMLDALHDIYLLCTILISLRSN